MVHSTAIDTSRSVHFICDDEIGISVAWCSHHDKDRKHVFSSADGSCSLIFDGELNGSLKPSSTLSAEQYSTPETELDIINHYVKHGAIVFESINGIFHGLLIDRYNQSVHLFNDRYGLNRIYIYEASDAVYFASEAKAILSVFPGARAYDEEGLTQHLAFGCTLGERSLFRGVRILDGASHWEFHRGTCKKRTYFSPAQWEQQDLLPTREFVGELCKVLTDIVPRYARSEGKIGMSLTAGLDTRMVMACLGPPPVNMVSFTYSGEDVDPLDARIAKRIAGAIGIEHQALRIESDFFDDFARLADDTVYVTDGNFGVFGAHEIYMSRKARALAPLRLTGNYGSEILRGVSTFKPAARIESLLDPGLHAGFRAAASHPLLRNTHPITFAAFKETPWNLHGNWAAGRSQLGFRTPYLDNAFVQLAYRGPTSPRTSRDVCIEVVRRCSPTLALIPTDKGYLGSDSPFTRKLRHAWGRATFKLDYINNEGFPSALLPIEPLFQGAMSRLGLLGLHKHLHYRSWIRDKLFHHVAERLTDPSLRQSSLWDRRALDQLAEDHRNGRRNRVDEINTVLTMQGVEQLLIKGQKYQPPQPAPIVLQSK